MEQNQMRRNIWDTASKAGLALGLTSAIYMFLTQWTGQSEMSPFIVMVLNGIFWLAKFLGCIWLMMFFMKKFASENPQADNSTTFRLGMAMALLSALVFSAISFANVAFISPELFTEQIDAAMQQMAPMLDSNTLSQVEKTMQNLPQITFISNLIYCFLYGLILSFILSRNIPSRDPFAGYKPEEQ